MLRLGLMGYGAIGKDVLAALQRGEITGMVCPAVLVRTPRDAQPHPHTVLTHDPEVFFSHEYDLVVEAAGHQAVREHAIRALRGGADIYVTSVGAFTDDALYEAVMAQARASGRRVVLPSAGIGALDMLTAAAQGGLDAVTITVRKDAASWKGTPAESAHDLDALAETTTLYDGPVRAGAAAYPQNVNISAAVAFAGIGLDQTRLRIFAEPGETPHVIEVEAEGAFGRLYFREEVAVSPENRKTGVIVAMAIVKTLRQLTSTLVVGG